MDDYYSMAIKLDPKMSAACYSRAMLYEKPEKYKDAKADLRKAAGLGDTDARARIEKINDEQRGKEQ